MSPIKTKKEVWSFWDRAWDLKLSKEERLAALNQCATPEFRYTSPDSDVPVTGGDFSALISLIEKLEATTGGRLQVKHMGWWEQHGQSLLYWDMIDLGSGKGVMPGYSYGLYGEDGRLTKVSDFWTPRMYS